MGPLLFVAFINSVTDVCLNPKSRIILFADDCCLVCPISDQASVLHMQQDFDSVVSHIQTQLHLSINPLKTKILHIKRPHCRNLIAPVITIDHNQIDIVDKQKYLGITLDSNFNYHCHTVNVCSQVKRAIGVFDRRFGRFVPQSVYVYLYIMLFRSILLYCIGIWYPATIYGRNLLEKTQKYVCRLILRNFDHAVNYDSLLSMLNLTPLYSYVFVRRLSMIRCFISGKRHIPPGILSFVSERGTRVSSRINHSWAITIPRFRHERSSRLALYLSAAAFNVVPFDIVVLPLRKFVRAIKCADLFNNIMRSLGSAKTKIVSVFTD